MIKKENCLGRKRLNHSKAFGEHMEREIELFSV